MRQGLLLNFARPFYRFQPHRRWRVVIRLPVSFPVDCPYIIEATRRAGEGWLERALSLQDLDCKRENYRAASLPAPGEWLCRAYEYWPRS